MVGDLKFPVLFFLSNLLCRPVVSFTTYTRYVYVLYPILVVFSDQKPLYSTPAVFHLQVRPGPRSRIRPPMAGFQIL